LLKTKKMEDTQEVTFDPPHELSEFSAAVWRMLVPRRCRSVERLVLLRAGLLAHDLAESYAATIATEGPLSKAPAASIPHAHPLVKLEAEKRKEFRAIWEKLGLQTSPLDMAYGRDKTEGIGLPICGEYDDDQTELVNNSLRLHNSPAASVDADEPNL
jgi:hypothetical protein